MNNEEKFKHVLKELLDEQHYTYDASNWEVASKHLDEEERKKRRFLFILFFGLGLGLFVAGYLFFSHTPKQAEISQTAHSAPSLASRPSINNANVKKTPDIQSETHATTQHPDLSKHEPAVPAKQPAVTQPASLVKASASEKTHLTFPAKANRVQAPGKIMRTKAISAPMDLAPVLLGNPAHLTSTIKSEETRTEKQKDEPTKTSADEPVKETFTTKEETPPSPTIVPSATINPKNAADESKQEVPVAQTGLKTDATASSVDTTQKEPEAATAATEKKDTTGKQIPKAPESSVQPSVQPAPKVNYCFAEAGAYLNFGWKYQGHTEGTSLNPYLGLSYMMFLSDKLSVSAGAYYTTVSQLKNTKEIRNSKVVFGEESQVTAITPQRLNYLSIPLRVHYAIDEKQVLMAGYSVGYLLDVQSQVDTYTERLDKRENELIYHTGGYVEGFKTFNSQLCIGYRRLLYKNLWLNGEFVYGLTDLRDDAFFGMHVNERTTGLKISLTYDLLKK